MVSSKFSFLLLFMGSKGKIFHERNTKRKKKHLNHLYHLKNLKHLKHLKSSTKAKLTNERT